MNIVKAFLVKLVFISVFTFGIYGIFADATIGRLFLISLIVTAVSFVGDVFILPRISQAVAGFADAGGYFVMYALLGGLVVQGTTVILPAFVAMLFIGAAEAIYHMYVMDVVHDQPRVETPIGDFLTELGDEENPDEWLEREDDEEDSVEEFEEE